MSPIRLRQSGKLFGIPFIRWNASRSGVSWTFRSGPISRNSRAKRWRVNLPGGAFYEQKRKPKPRASKTKAGTGAKAAPKVPANLLPLANWCTVVASAGTVATLLFGAPLWVAAGVGVFGFGAVGLVVKHIRNKHAQGQPVASQPWRPTAAAGHSPTCRAKSPSTCRCPGRRRKRTP